MKEQKRYAQLYKRLHEERAEALETATGPLHEDMRESLGELSVVDNHPADIGTEVYQRSQDVAQHDRLVHRIEAIDAALERFDEGKYGQCEHCGHDIPFERLEALHYTTVCTQCSREEEVEEQHSLDRDPVENELLSNPFSRTFNDGTNRDVVDPSDIYDDADEVIGAVQYIETIETVSEAGQGGNAVHYSTDHGLT